MKAESITLPPLPSQNPGGKMWGKVGTWHCYVVCHGGTGIKSGLLLPHQMKELLFAGTWIWPATKGRGLGSRGHDQAENGDESGR